MLPMIRVEHLPACTMGELMGRLRVQWPRSSSRTFAPLIRATLSVLTTFPILYAICMRNHRIIIGNVVACCTVALAGDAKSGAPISSHNFSQFNNISNMLRYLYEKPPHNNRKCGLHVQCGIGWWEQVWLTRCALTCITTPRRTSYKNLSSLNYHGNGLQTGHNAELHAVVSVLTGVVGLGDYTNMTNGTLIRRLARKDGVLLKPDRPLSLMDLQLAGTINASRALPMDLVAGGGRAWSTHV